MQAVYEQWRSGSAVEATTAWATWLLRHGRGQDAIAVVARARSALGDADGLEVERRWKTVVDGGDADAEARSAAREDDRHVMAHAVGEDADA